MANPQTEDGFTKIANELLDFLCHTNLGGEKRQVFDFIIRKTYGFHKKTDAIALSQICIGTKMTKSAVCRAIRVLKMKNIIFTYHRGYMTEYEINKDYSSWNDTEPYNRLEIIKRDKYMCHICHSVKKETELEIDHIIPLWLNGSNKEDNLSACCATCNRKKGVERLRYKIDTVSELPLCQNDDKDCGKIVKKTVAKKRHTKDNNIQKKIIQKKGEIVGSKDPTPKQKAETFFNSVEKFIKDKESVPEVTEFLRDLHSKHPNIGKVKLWTEVKDFCMYWTEKTADGKRSRWQLQKTFEVERRLVTWLNKAFNGFSKNHYQDNKPKGKEIII